MHKKILDFCKYAGQPQPSIIEQHVRSFTGDTEPTLHPYGFFIWKLASSVSAYSLRMHVWLPGIRPRQKPDWPPHSHNSDLFSLLLFGEILNHEWDWRSNPSGDNEIYAVRYRGDQSMLKKTNEYGRLTNKKVVRAQQGEAYHVAMGRIHASEVAFQQTAVTLVLLFEKTGGESKVIGSRAGETEYIFHRNAVTHENHIAARNVALSGVKNFLQ